MDKMIQTGNGDVTITNDGATILKQMSVIHPAAKMVCFYIKLFVSISIFFFYSWLNYLKLKILKQVMVQQQLLLLLVVYLMQPVVLSLKVEEKQCYWI
jgi:hypothetical protein